MSLNTTEEVGMSPVAQLVPGHQLTGGRKQNLISESLELQQDENLQTDLPTRDQSSLLLEGIKI